MRRKILKVEKIKNLQLVLEETRKSFMLKAILPSGKQIVVDKFEKSLDDDCNYVFKNALFYFNQLIEKIKKSKEQSINLIILQLL